MKTYTKASRQKTKETIINSEKSSPKKKIILIDIYIYTHTHIYISKINQDKDILGKQKLR